jgi:hypothetical protein
MKRVEAYDIDYARYMTKEITQEEIMARDTLLFISEAKVLFKSLAQPVGATEKKISDSVSCPVCGKRFP